MRLRLIQLYEQWVLRNPLVILIALTAVLSFFLLHTPDFELDASADSLVLENDSSLKYYRSLRARYGSDDFLIVTYSPTNNLFSPEVLQDIGELRDQLLALPAVKSAISLLDVPLVDSPPMTLAEIAQQVRTLESEGADIELAREEMTNSPLYQNLLVSSDGKTTAMQINLVANQPLNDLINQRDQLYGELNKSTATTDRISQLTTQIKRENLARKIKIEQTIKDVRAIMDQHRDSATLFLGGVPMIASDSIDFIRSDLQVFGVGVVLFIVIILAFSFAQLRWVVLPLVVCVLSALSMVGFLGWANWPVTVVSSNFVSLLLIITLSLIIHLVVRYREVAANNTDISQFELVQETVRSKFAPCFYTAITTMVAFGSLLVSGIRPVIDFGWMMVIGISVSFVLAFTLFPAALMLLPRLGSKPGRDLTGAVTAAIANFIQHRTRATWALFGLLILIALSGIPRLSVENRFIDYYKSDTEIYQGMTLIDTQLGGTTPLEVIVNAPADFLQASEEYGQDGDITSSSYWFNSDGLREVAEIHDYLDSLPQTGKVLSLHTAMQMLESLNDDKAFSDFMLAIVYKRIPDSIKKPLITPYISADGNQLRFSIRLYESSKNLKRQQLLDQIRFDLRDRFGLDSEQIEVSGMAVLYNNLLQSLFRSQIMTLGAVFIAILIMFIGLFRAFKLPLAAIVPNIISAGLILGLMGWIGIPLDIMTITIAAINIGIGVDDSIHYIHRFREEFSKDQDHWAAIHRCHDSIARAMYYTTVTVVLGFSILTLSNFIPTIYFGILSGLAMLTALIANLMLLPILLARFRLS